MLGGLAIAGACSSGSAGSPDSETLPQQPPSVVTRDIETGFECDDECLATFWYQRVSYRISCRAIKDEMVETVALDSDLVSGRRFELHAVRGHGPDVLVALSAPAGYCVEGDPDQHPTNWAVAFPDGVDIETLRVAVCDVGSLSTTEYLADGCHRHRDDLISCGRGPPFPPEILDDLTLLPSRSSLFGERLEAIFVEPTADDLDGWRVVVDDEQSDGELVQLLLRESDDGTIEFAIAGASPQTRSSQHPERCVPTPAA